MSLSNRRVEDAQRQGDELCALLQESEDARTALEKDHFALTDDFRALQQAFDELTVEVKLLFPLLLLLLLLVLLTTTYHYRHRKLVS